MSLSRGFFVRVCSAHICKAAGVGWLLPHELGSQPADGSEYGTHWVGCKSVSEMRGCKKKASCEETETDKPLSLLGL